MTPAPDLIFMNDFPGWDAYEDAIYAIYLETVAHARLTFRSWPLRVRFNSETKRKGHGFWHLVSEAPTQDNRNEEERIPDLRRCERVRWVAWCILQADAGAPGFSWWENERGRDTHVVIWAEPHDYAVVLGKRPAQQGRSFYLLKTAYCLRSHAIRKFTKERDAWRATQKD